MSRAWTLSDLKARLESACDIQNDGHISDTEKYDMLATAVAATWDKLLAAEAGEKYCKKVNFTTTPGTADYPLSSVVTAGDFFKVHSLYVDETNGQYRPIEKINPVEVQSFRAPTSSTNMVLWYIPSAPTFKSAGVYVPSTSFDGINGWEEHAVMGAAVMVKNKREEDASGFYRRKQELEQRMVSSGSNDWYGPSRVNRRRNRVSRDPYWVYKNNINSWMLRGDALVLMYLYGYIP
jgi:hypothetical protein